MPLIFITGGKDIAWVTRRLRPVGRDREGGLLLAAQFE
jgi:hypothetical protein